DIIRSIPVTLDNIPQIYLNELEYADGWIYANQWNSYRILQIDPSSGFVEALIDASNLLSPGDRLNAGPLNGIAWDSQRQAFLLTGKLWPWIFVVRFEEPI
ncbi:MAG: glutaminyl-peptide cyclotransferase, partial [Candidatus Fermentibacteraceae bacterium]|nr:glutaminyl-peptide cyclotransferase [Candidatus Fermentibacteraceae bacterium]